MNDLLVRGFSEWLAVAPVAPLGSRRTVALGQARLRSRALACDSWEPMKNTSFDDWEDERSDVTGPASRHRTDRT